MTSGIKQFLSEKKVDLRDFGLAFARLIANLAVDPHGYFEKKYTARIESSHSDHEICSVLTQLMQWVDSPIVTEAERARLDRQLGELGYPCVDDLRGLLLP